MGLFDKLFSRKTDADAERAKALIRKAWEDSGKPKGAYKAAVRGAEIRRQFVSLAKEVEANLSEPVVITAEDALMVHPKLMEEIRKRPDAAALEIALTLCFITEDARRGFNEAWPSHVAQYRGRGNSETVLREKSGLLATYVVHNLDAVEMTEGETSDEQSCMVRVEETAVWYRVLDELAFRLLRGAARHIHRPFAGRVSRELSSYGKSTRLDRPDDGRKIEGVCRLSAVAPGRKCGCKGYAALGGGEARWRADRPE